MCTLVLPNSSHDTKSLINRDFPAVRYQYVHTASSTQVTLLESITWSVDRPADLAVPVGHAHGTSVFSDCLISKRVLSYSYLRVHSYSYSPLSFCQGYLPITSNL